MVAKATVSLNVKKVKIYPCISMLSSVMDTITWMKANALEFTVVQCPHNDN